MNYRQLGRYGVKVSEVALGGWLTHGRSIADETTSEIVHRAFDLGINFFDTADVYNAGEAEKSLGKAIAGLRREDLFIATKCFFPMSDRPNDRGLSRKHIVESVHNSLSRMGIDYIDLMQFHRYDETTPVDESVRAVEDLIRQGKVLYWGTSEWKAHQIVDAFHISTYPAASNQPVYNMLQRGIESSVIPACEELGIGQVVFSPLAQGVLTGKYLPGQPPPEGSRGADAESNMFMGRYMTDEVLSRVQKLKGFAEERGLTMPQLALAWCLRQPNVSSVIVGATSVRQLEANVAASGVELQPEDFEEAEAILEQ
ncbi:MAG TPA: aldo/keto reductase family protein [Fimbriimonadaceae bacterium]|nr:aldo/keto reductase family protein [Fimbriimonadaceae bacterium]